MPKPDAYRHLENDQPLKLTVSMDDLAKQLVSLNYGAHRMLSSLVRELRAADNDSPLAEGIEKLLNDGCFY